MIPIIQSLGLSKTEAEIYLASLELGPSSAIQLAAKLGVTRQLMYNLLPGMIEQGFMKEVTVGKRSYFQAVDPEVLRDKAENLLEAVSEAIPKLQEKRSPSGAVPLITTYDNPLSMREWYRSYMDHVKRGEEKLVYSTEEGWISLDPEFYRMFSNFQKRKGVRNRIIAPDTEKSREAAISLEMGPDTYRFAPEGWEGFSSKWIWRNQVCVLTLRGKSTNLVVIESAELAALERFAFERTWKSLAG